MRDLHRMGVSEDSLPSFSLSTSQNLAARTSATQSLLSFVVEPPKPRVCFAKNVLRLFRSHRLRLCRLCRCRQHGSVSSAGPQRGGVKRHQNRHFISHVFLRSHSHPSCALFAGPGQQSLFRVPCDSFVDWFLKSARLIDQVPIDPASETVTGIGKCAARVETSTAIGPAGTVQHTAPSRLGDDSSQNTLFVL
jgi:hypothetical protein